MCIYNIHCICIYTFVMRNVESLYYCSYVYVFGGAHIRLSTLCHQRTKFPKKMILMLSTAINCL